MEPIKFHNNFNSVKQDKNSWTFAFPGTHWCNSYPLVQQLDRLLPLSPFNSWVDRSNMSKVSCSRKQQQKFQSDLRNWKLNPGPLDYLADALSL